MTFPVTLWNANIYIRFVFTSENAVGEQRLQLIHAFSFWDDGQTYIGEILDLSRLVD